MSVGSSSFSNTTSSKHFIPSSSLPYFFYDDKTSSSYSTLEPSTVFKPIHEIPFMSVIILLIPRNQTTHLMITKGHAGISKPRTFHAMTMILSTSIFHVLTIIKKPKGLKSTIKQLEWLVAMDDEITTLKAYKTWILVPQPSSYNIVDCHWVFKPNYGRMVPLSVKGLSCCL